MALTMFKEGGYGVLEINHAEFRYDGSIISQTPLGEEFTKDAPCENGMWLCADRSKGYVGSVEALDEPMGIVFTAEKEYDSFHYGLKNFGRKIAGDYPRVGIFNVGDVFTTNCLQYDTDEFTDMEALKEALKAAAETPVYVAPVVGSGVPKLTATKPEASVYGKVVKLYTIPNGEPGVKYTIVKA